MAAQDKYKCTQCEKSKEVPAGDSAPECCGQAMVAEPAEPPMEQCTLSSTAEHSRMDDTGEPCDDGRAG